MNCEHENCDLPPKYGKINHSTGRLEKKHCKAHKQEGEKGRAPPWSKGYQNFVTIAKIVSYTLNISKEEWIAGTKKDGVFFRPKMKCPVGHDVKDTSINNFVNHGARCPTCSGQVPWSERYEHFKEICKKAGYTLLETEDSWIAGTKKDGKKFKPKMKCPVGHTVDRTCISDFVSKKPACRICSDNVPWIERYEEFNEICKKAGYTLLETKDSWIAGTKKDGKNFKPEMICPEGHTVDRTSIDNFVSQKPACRICSGNIPWSQRYEHFKEICKKFCYTLLESEDSWKTGTKKDGKKFKPKMKCPVGDPVNNTTIDMFVNNGRRCPKCAMKRSQKLMTEIVEKLYPNNKFQCDFRPSFLKYNKGSNLELDMYCEELKLAFEYDGEQHRKYVKCFHKTEQKFIEQQERDVWKDAKCKELGIILIRIPDKDGDICIDCYNPENMETYIKSQIQ